MTGENKKSRIRRIWIIAAAVIFALVFFLLIATDSRMVVRRYTVDAENINERVRLVLITDLHSCYYGEGQKDLVAAVEKQAPDAVLLGGDIFDDEIGDTNTELFLAGIAGKYPMYYVTGNHEHWSGLWNFTVKMGILEKYGVTVLSGEYVELEINGQKINLCGVNDPVAYMTTPGAERSEVNTVFANQLEAVSASAGNGNYTVLLSHRPERFSEYAEYDFDLVLCGHAHGGQWRIPFILNGLFAPNQDFFPEYAGGRYKKDGITMIVSRGLARESTRVPRIFNRPELVIVELR